MWNILCGTITKLLSLHIILNDHNNCSNRMPFKSTSDEEFHFMRKFIQILENIHESNRIRIIELLPNLQEQHLFRLSIVRFIFLINIARSGLLLFVLLFGVFQSI